MATPSGSPSIITISDDTSGAIVGSPPIELVASNGTPQSYATQATTNESSIQSVQPPLATSVHTLATSVAATCSTISGRISESLIPSAMILDRTTNIAKSIAPNVVPPQLAIHMPTSHTDTLAPATREGRPEHCMQLTPIKSLNPYQSVWTIEGRVIKKGNLNNYSTENRIGQVFSFDIIDKSNSDIVVNSFDLATTSYYNQIQLGKTYTIKGGTLRTAKKDYNNSTTPWDIILDLDSSVKLSTNQSVNIPQYLFRFKTIAEINSAPAKSTIDLLAIALSITAPSTIRKSDSTFNHKRTVVLSDNSALCIEATLWGTFSDNEGKLLSELCATQTSIRPVLAIKRAKTTTFKGTTLATGLNTQIFIDPDITEAHALRAWFTSLTSTTAYPSVSIGKIEKTYIASMKSSSQLGKPLTFSTATTIIHINMSSFSYPTCTSIVKNHQCKKKLDLTANSSWYCQKCKHDVSHCDYKYALHFIIEDGTSTTWVTTFDEVATSIMGISAQELQLLAPTPDKFGLLLSQFCSTATCSQYP
ncbi:hypothetical protein KI387_035371 [Taxus chinensis]|uniref:Replication protein A subunit n=1 Tax=Taxus chinensis TaxID=29808 RepID=A0AA38KZL6_TAXCH|nr:hypothetical protein KI387_035371 [Taxus chinensis]